MSWPLSASLAGTSKFFEIKDCGQVMGQHSTFILKVIEKGVSFSSRDVYYFL